MVLIRETDFHAYTLTKNYRQTCVHITQQSLISIGIITANSIFNHSNFEID